MLEEAGIHGRTEYRYNAFNQQIAMVMNNGQIQENQYDAFGVIRSKNESVHNRILYTGQQYDQVTGQYYLRVRYYKPLLGRFTQEDTYRGDGLNLYSCCQNNPVVYYDPSGYSEQPTCKNYTPNETEVVGKGVTGPYYEKIKRKHAENPNYFPAPDNIRIVEGKEYGNKRSECNTKVKCLILDAKTLSVKLKIKSRGSKRI